MIQKYKIIVAYDGTDYHGWQRQKNGSTIVGTLEKTFLSVFKKKISIFGASRTDAGVHALGQVATFSSEISIDSHAMLKAWNNKLPNAVTIRSLEKVSLTFNPHYNIIEKHYEYTFTLTRPLPSSYRFQWHYQWPINIEKLQTSLEIFVGKHDFRSFCTGNDHKSTIRTIHTITLEQKNKNTYTLNFHGPGFLRYMIRRMTGSLLEVASRPHIPITYLKKILDNQNPEHRLPTAPARGLTLKSILYSTENSQF